MRKKTNIIIMGMVLILTLALVLTGCGKKNDTSAEENYIVSANKIELGGLDHDSLEGTVWVASASNDAFSNHGRIDFISDSELFLMVIDGQTGEYAIIEKDEYIYEDGVLKVDKDSAITAIDFGDNSIIVTFNNGFKLNFRWAKNEQLMPEDSITGYLQEFANSHPSGQSTPDNEGELANTVWLGTKSDIMFEYRLEIVSGTELYMLRMQNGNTVAIEKGSYSFDGSELSINGISMIDTVSYDANANRITIKTANDGLLFNFRMTDEAVMSSATLSALIDGSGGNHGSNTGGNSNKPTQDSDGKYVYNVGGVEVHASVNIWDYIDGDTFDLYKMLRDNGFELEFVQYQEMKNGAVVTKDGALHHAVAPNGDYLFFGSKTNDPDFAPKNSAGLVTMTSVGHASSDVNFEFSSADIEESTYKLSDPRFGMSLDQAVVVAAMIDGVHDEVGFDWYRDIFGSWKAGTRIYVIP